jgi:hypothetical protein
MIIRCANTCAEFLRMNIYQLFFPLNEGPRTTILNNVLLSRAGMSPIPADLNFFGREAPKSGIPLMIMPLITRSI